MFSSHRQAWLCLALTWATSAIAAPDAPSYTVQQTGASFVEAPPDRDKNLSPASVSSGERVEAHAVLSFKNRMVIDVPSFGRDAGRVTATALFKDKTIAPLGNADVAGYRRISTDRRRTLVTVSIARLPDKPIVGVTFEGQVKVTLARNLKKTSTAFQPKAGSRFDTGIGAITLARSDATSITLTGDQRLSGLAGVRIVKADGGSVPADMTAFTSEGGVQGTTVTSQWQFNQTVPAGRIEFTLYEGQETIEVPVSLVVMKPY